MLAGARSLAWGLLGAWISVSQRDWRCGPRRFSRSSAVALRTSLTVARSRAANGSPGWATVSRALPAKRDHDRLDSWLQRFARAWEERDPDGAAALFSEHGSYRETPFDEPLRGAQAIRTYWSNLPQAQSDIRFAYELLAVTEQWGIAHWHGSYTPVDRATRLELDGILLVSLDDDGRCEDFREWSNRRLVAAARATG
jgi:hypothetical protein